MPNTVSIVRCADYDRPAVGRAVAEAVAGAGGLEVAGKVVLLKPNLLGTPAPGKPAASEPVFLRAAIRVLRSAGAARILVGDSPAVQSGDLVGMLSGLKSAALDEGAEWVDFADPVEVAVPEARLVRRFSLARVVTEVDCVVSLCRLKTHSFMYFTGAAKNLFGAVVGLQKSAFHLRFPAKAEFGTMLADLVLAVKPAFAIMDAIVAMEGPGPLNGTATRLGLVLAGRDVFAVDWVAASVVGYDPADIPYLAAAAANPASGFDPADVAVSGLPLSDAKVSGFRLVRVVHSEQRVEKGPLGRAVRNLAVPRPYFVRERCVVCGACVKICPAAALAVGGDQSGRFIEVDYRTCLRCYCCHEVCPEDAIDLRRRLF